MDLHKKNFKILCNLNETHRVAMPPSYLKKILTFIMTKNCANIVAKYN